MEFNASRDPFYYSTVRNITAGFMTIFDQLDIINDYGDRIRVPLFFAPQDKFLTIGQQQPDYEDKNFATTLPRMGVAIVGMNYAPERALNALSQLTAMYRADDDKFMYNRVPIDIQYELYIGTTKLNDMLKIVEQIVPFFTPEMVMTINDKEDFDLQTNIPVNLNSLALDLEYEGTFDTERIIMSTIGFTCKGFMYSNVRNYNRIKETIVNMNEADLAKKFETIVSRVVPRTASKNDPHVIETFIEGHLE